MNYIKHLNQFFDKVKEDERLTPFHISLYMALFQQWNQSHFRKSISIARDEIKRIARIGSNNTYSRCLKELHSWQYIEYKPSHYMHTGSQVVMINFDTSIEISSDTTSDTSNGNSTDTSGDIRVVQPLIPYINNIKHIKPILNNTNNSREEEKNLNSKNRQVEDLKNASPENLENSADETFPPSTLTEEQAKLNEKKKVASKKKSERGEAGEHSFCQSPYFSLEKLSEALANTDYTHANLKYYHEVVNNWSESKGAKKKDWLATIKNWILRDVQAGKLVKVEQPVSNDPYDNDRFRERMAKYASIWNRGKS